MIERILAFSIRWRVLVLVLGAILVARIDDESIGL